MTTAEFPYVGDKHEPLRRHLAAIDTEEYAASKRIYDAFADGRIEADEAAGALAHSRMQADRARVLAYEAPSYAFTVMW